ncbi:dihydrofolate reductase family protein [Kineococcus sp. NUM-3379]
MRELTYYVGVTVDGYIAGPDGDTGFFPLAPDVLDFIRAEFPETLPTHVRAQLGVTATGSRFDTVVMGRGTYQPGLDAGYPSPYGHLRQYVLSRSLPGPADPAVEVVAADPVGLVRRLKAEAGGGVWLAGGGALASQLLDEIDELVLKRYPVLAGAGIPVLGGRPAPRALSVTGERTFRDGTVVTTYRPAA